MPIEHVQFITSDNKDFITSDNRNFFVKDVTPPPPPPPVGQFSINLYINTAEPARVDKTDHLSGLGTINGTLREATDIINPIIMIEYEGLPTFNYISIEAFSRYYYVRNIVSVYNNLWAIECECDVLMSYKDYIYDLECLIKRQQNIYNCVNAKYMYDELIPMNNKITIDKSDFPYTPFKTHMAGTGIKNIVITVVGKGTTPAPRTSTLPSSCLERPDTTFPQSPAFSNVYVTDYRGLLAFLDKIWTTSIWNNLKTAFTDPIENIISIKEYPFDLVSHDSDCCIQLTSSDKIKIGLVDIEIDSSELPYFYKVSPNYNAVFDFGTKIITESGGDARFDFEPYTELYLYLPYIGTIKINPIEWLNHYMRLEYAIDFGTGKCKAFIFNTDDNEPILIETVEGYIGQDVPYSAVNGAAIMRSALQAGLGVTSGAASVATGVALLAL